MKLFTKLFLTALLLFSFLGNAQGALWLSESGGTADDTAYDATSWDNNLDAATKNALRDKIETLAGGHDPVTLGTANGLSLSTQALSLAAATNATPGAATAAQIVEVEANTLKKSVGVWDSSSEITISAGGVAALSNEGYFTIDTNGDIASDDLTQITGLADGDEIIIGPNNDARTVVLKNGANLILCRGYDFILNNTKDRIRLQDIGSDILVELSRSSGGD